MNNKKLAIYYVGDRVFTDNCSDSETVFTSVYKEAKAYAKETGLTLYRALITIDFAYYNNGLMLGVKDNMDFDLTHIVDML